ncbi:MAG TPA: hypothetical protein VEW25_09040 [Allosphingosinicella sp.]|nr:hypothetical protein [Allosphingosinicella sp.]
MRTILRAGVFAAALVAALPAAAEPGSAAPDGAGDELAGGYSDGGAPETSQETDEAAPPRRARRGRERGPAHPRIEVAPYVEVNAGISAELSGDEDEVLTYTSVAAGVDARVQTRRVTAQASYRYERRIALDGDVAEDDVHSGVAMVHAEVAPGVSLDAGALAAQAGGAGRGLTLSDRDSSAQVFSAYAGPTFNGQIGGLTVGAAYRLGYVRVDDDDISGDFGEDFGESIVHNASASVGMGPGRLPFGWTVGGGYVREESGEFDNRFQAAYVRGDLVFPVGPTLALTAGVGYEHITSSQQDVLRDAGGAPIMVGGRFVPDPTRPRLRGFDTDGLIYDGGIIWRPNPRTELQARAGRRYGGTTVTGSLRHQLPRGLALNAAVYDTVGNAATAIVSNLNALPTDFQVNRNPLTGAFDGCVFGNDPGTGICFDQAFQTLSSASFRARGANLMLSGSRGPWGFGLGAGYAHRRYTALISGDIGSIDPVTDDSFVVNAGVSRRLGRFSSMSIDAVAAWYQNDRPFSDTVFSTSLTGGYYRSFLIPGLQFHAGLGIYHTNAGLIDSTVLQGLVGLRYTF